MKKQFPIDKSKVLTQRILNISAELNSSGYEITITEDKHVKQKVYTFTWKQASQ